MGIDRRTKVYKIGSTYYAEKSDGAVISASGTFETVLQAALNLGGTIHIDQTGTFTFNTIGVQIPVYTHLQLGQSTVLSPPASSSGFTMINIGDHPTGNVRNAKVTGGRLLKATGEQDWTAIKISSPADAEGNVWTFIQDVVMYYPGTGILFDTVSDGWISNANINRTTIYYSLIGVDFQKSGTRDNPFRSVFDDVTIQSLQVATGKHNLYGFKNVRWKDLTFRDCKVWDLQDSTVQKSMLISPIAQDIRINGGTIARNDGAAGFFLNNATSRSISIDGDEWQPPSYGSESLTQTSFVANGRRKGGWIPGAGGWGITNGAWSNNGTGTTANPVVTYADGSICQRFTAADATATSSCGIMFPKLVTCRGWNPIYKAKFRLNVAGGRRGAFGFVGNATTPINADDNLNGLQGIILGSRTADTTWRILANDAAGGQTAVDTGVTIDTSIVTVEIVATDSRTTKWMFSVNGAAWTTMATTVNIPQQTDTLVPYAALGNGSATQKNFDLFEVYVETK